MLSDRTIRKLIKNGRLGIKCEPRGIEDIQFQPASVELRLGNEFIHRASDGDHKFDLWKNEPLVVTPGQCLLGTTWERVSLPNNMIAVVDGKSTWGRKFLIVHSTAGYIDPGFDGEITLEIKNIGEQDVVVHPGDRICQLRFFWTDTDVDRPYGHPSLRSHYSGQQGPTLPHSEVLQ